MAEDGETAAGAAFWHFSHAFYALPGVAGALLALQDDGGFDVNLILYGLWLGHSGHGRLDRDGFDAAERAILGLRSAIVAPLRQLRRQLKEPLEADVRRLRAAIGELELMAERAVQERLAVRAGAVDRTAGSTERRADAAANLVLYLGPDGAAGAEAAVILREFAAFPAS
jgi:uncharacterized protein (TIGR02444 family)